MSFSRLYHSIAKVYDITTVEGKKRLETTRKRLRKIIEELGLKLHKEDKVLVLMSGSCIEGFALALELKIFALCLDINKELIEKRRKHAKELGLSLEFRICDVRSLEKCLYSNERFKLVTLWGSSLTHLSIWGFDKLVTTLKNYLY